MVAVVAMPFIVAFIVPSTVRLPPTYIDPPTPTPPAICRAPELVELAITVDVLIMVPELESIMTGPTESPL